MHAPAQPRPLAPGACGLRPLEAALFVLLACNAVLFVFVGSAPEALDAAAWLTLLALFALEARAAVRGARACAAAAVLVAAALYVRAQAWLEAANSALWIAVAGLLELELRRPELLAHRRAAFTAAAAALYSGLAALVAAWAVRGEWFDAYDAALWLAAFGAIELELLGARRTRVDRARATGPGARRSVRRPKLVPARSDPGDGAGWRPGCRQLDRARVKRCRCPPHGQPRRRRIGPATNRYSKSRHSSGPL